MTRSLLLLTTIAIAAAAVTDCGSAWTVQHFSADPPAVVGAGQNVTMTATIDVPTEITSGIIHLQGAIAPLLDIEIQRPLCEYLQCPLTAGTYTWSWVDFFPSGFMGRVQVEFKVMPLRTAGPPQKIREEKPWLCLRWTAFSTGSASNATSAIIGWLYS